MYRDHVVKKKPYSDSCSGQRLADVLHKHKLKIKLLITKICHRHRYYWADIFHLDNEYFLEIITPFFIPYRNSIYDFPKWEYTQVGFLSNEYETVSTNTYRNLKSSKTFVINNLSGKFYLTFFA